MPGLNWFEKLYLINNDPDRKKPGFWIDAIGLVVGAYDRIPGRDGEPEKIQVSLNFDDVDKPISENFRSRLQEQGRLAFKEGWDYQRIMDFQARQRAVYVHEVGLSSAIDASVIFGNAAFGDERWPERLKGRNNVYSLPVKVDEV